MNHRLHLFDTSQSLAQSVTDFLLEGYEQGDNLLIAAKPRHLDTVLRALDAKGCFRTDNHRQRLVALDAVELVRLIRVRGTVSAERFEAELGTLVERLSMTGRLRVYGEIVEVFAEEGDFEGAIQLERLWNGLAARFPFTLMCGYSSAHFTGSRPALREICEAHSDIRTGKDDTLAHYLLTTT